jgi:hypothetical protein
MITASTPTFSADKAKLPKAPVVATIEEAREAAISWDICAAPALKKRGGVEGILNSSDAKNKEGLYDLERYGEKWRGLCGDGRWHGESSLNLSVEWCILFLHFSHTPLILPFRAT